MSHSDPLPGKPSGEVRDLHRQAVLVLTSTGRPVSMGSIRVTRIARDTIGRRVELLFETPQMCCALGLSDERVAQLRASYDGYQYIYRLPPGQVWLNEAALPVLTSVTIGLETYPLPESPVAPAALVPLTPAARPVSPRLARPVTRSAASALATSE